MNENSPAKGVVPQGAPRRGEALAPGKIGILLVNLGTPDGTDYWSVRRYLKEFLSDRRVIETNRVLWWFILNGIVLTVRPSKSGEAYRSIWNEDLDELPLRTITRSQARRSRTGLDHRDELVVDWAMRYGNPSIASRIEALAAPRLRAASRVPALPAICRGDDRHRQRRGVRHAEEDAGAAGAAHRAPIPEGSRLYRRDCELDSLPSCRSSTSSRR